jgi:hypothetical protein
MVITNIKSTRKNTEGSTTIYTHVGSLRKILVGKGGDLCTMTVYDDTTIIWQGILNDENTHKGKETKPYEIDFQNKKISTSLKVDLHSPAAVLHYKLNKTTGSVAIDSGSYASNGTLTNMSNDDWVQGKKYYGVAFDGADDRIACGVGSKAFDCYAAWTISSWIYSPDITRDGVIFANNISNKQLYCGINGDGTCFVRIQGSTSGQIRPLSVDALPNTQWFHFVMTYDGSSDASGVRIYINGVEQDVSLYVLSDLVGTTKITQEIFIGSHVAGATPFAGTIDDFRLYQEELTPEEVTLLYNDGIGTEEDFTVADITVIYET